MSITKKLPAQWGYLFAIDMSKDTQACAWMGDGTWGFPCTKGTFMRKMKLEDTPHTCEEVKHLPVTWCKLMKVKILDPDGWREDNKSWEAPLTRVDFLARAAKSTTNRLDYGEDAKATPKPLVEAPPLDYDKIKHYPAVWLKLMGKTLERFTLWQKDPSWTRLLTRVEFLEQLQFELFRERDNQQLETPKSKVKVDVIGKRIKDTEAILYEGHMIGGNFHTDCAFRVVLTNQVAILEAILAANS